MGLIRILIYAFMVLLSCSCGKKAQLPHNKYAERDSTVQKIIEMNTMLSDMEEADIDEYVEKSGKRFNTTGTGVRISIDNECSSAKGDSVRNGDLVKLEYKLESTDGKLIYDKTGKNAETIEVGKGRRQTGLAEGLTNLREGDSATIVVPSILAYGALGDQNQIQPRQTLVYKIVSIKTLKSQKTNK